MHFNIQVSVEYDIFNIQTCVNRMYELGMLDQGAKYKRKTTIQNTILSGRSERG
jgi:hypothetical protein